MGIVVQKFGGTSVADVERIRDVAQIIKAEKVNNEVVVVVSAMSGATNRIIALCSDVCLVSNQAHSREYDVALSTGEILSSALLALALQSIGVQSVSLQCWQIKILTNKAHNNALIQNIDDKVIKEYLKNDIVPIVTGFQGVTDDNQVTTLGRGGSDITAVSIAAALQAQRCDIYTDVDGVYSADPRLIHNAVLIPEINYEEMLEYAEVGAKVLHPRCILIGMKYQIPIKVISSFTKKSGTIVKNMENTSLTGITYNKNLVMVKYKEISEILLRDIEVLFAFQNNCVISAKDLYKLNIAPVSKVALVSIIGHFAKHLLNKSISLLIKENFDVKFFSSSCLKVSIIVDEEQAEMCVKLLHEHLF